MKAVIVRCPNCNANLQVGNDMAQTTCSYCGTVSRIQARTTMFQIPKKPAMPMQSAQMTNMERMQQLQQLAKMPIAVQKASAIFVLIPIITMIVVAAGVIFAVKKVSGGIGGLGGSKMMWAGHQPVLIDVDGDGVPDPIGLTRYVQNNDRAHFAAFSGKTGAELWETEPLGQYSTVSQGHVGGIGNLLLHASETGVLTARDAKAKGAVKWQVQFSEKIDMLCATGKGEIAVGTADQKWFVVDPKGAKREGKKLLRFDRDYTNDSARAAFDHADATKVDANRPDPGVIDMTVPAVITDVCVPLIAGRHLAREVISMRAWRDVANVPNMRPEYLSKRPGGPTIAIGAKTPGTAVPMIARLAPAPTPTPTQAPDKFGRHRRDEKDLLPGAAWVVEVPAVDLLQSRLDAEHVTISDKAIFALYQGANSTHRITAFDLATGKRLWDRQILHGSGFVVVGLTVTGDVVMLSTWQNLIAFGAADGGDRFVIGGSW